MSVNSYEHFAPNNAKGLFGAKCSYVCLSTDPELAGQVCNCCKNLAKFESNFEDLDSFISIILRRFVADVEILTISLNKYVGKQFVSFSLNAL